jgi:hypothetical protein
MADLYVTIKEEISLFNIPKTLTNVYNKISGVNYVDTRIMNCPVGSKTEIFSLGNVNGAGQFTTSSLQYARITNNSLVPIKLLISSSATNAQFLISSKNSFYLSTSKITGSADSSFTLEDIRYVFIEPSGSNADIEYFIATT